jgi:membrane protease YdiL (CAAX protease family)
MDPIVEIPDAPERPDDPAVTWRWWEAFVVFLIGAVLVGGILAAPGVVIVQSKKLEQIILSSCTEVGMGTAAFLWLWYLHRSSIRALGIPANVRREAGVGVLAGLGLYAAGVFVVGVIVTILLQQASNHHVHAPRQVPSHLSGPDLVLVGITVIVFAPIAEELLFRGMLFRSLRAGHSFVFAGLISAFFFGLVHYPPHGALHNALLLPLVMFFVGFGLAGLYEWRGNIVANIAAHSAFNVIGFLFIWLAVAR